MMGLIIGMASGLVTIFFIRLLRFLDEQTVYGLILCGIGFLYVGYTWTDLLTAVICAVQAIAFLFLAYFGTKHSLLVLAAGYFLHGSWDLAYGLWGPVSLLPPHYDLFCLTIDFVIGFYLLLVNYKIVSFVK